MHDPPLLKSVCIQFSKGSPKGIIETGMQTRLYNVHLAYTATSHRFMYYNTPQKER